MPCIFSKMETNRVLREANGGPNNKMNGAVQKGV